MTAFSKVFKKVIHARLYKHLNNHNALVNEQSGLRAQSSTEEATFILINKMLEASKSKKLVGSIFCDLEKAFDSVNYDKLLSKLKFYGISGSFYNLIRFYLTNRYQSLKTRCVSSQ
jgi:hypothetical protein